MASSALDRLVPGFRLAFLPDTVQEAMSFSGLLGWELERGPAFSQRGGELLEIPGISAVTRKADNAVLSPARALGVVGSAYHIRNNEDFLPFLQALSDKAGAPVTHAGHFDNSRRVLVALGAPQEIPQIGPYMDYYITLIVDHSGNLAPTLSLLPVERLTGTVMNVFSWAPESLVLNPEAERFAPRVDHAVQSFQMSQRMAHESLLELAHFQVTEEQVRTMALRALESSTSSPAALTRTENKVELILHRLRALGDPSGFTALLAFCYYWDFDAPVRGEEAPELMRARRSLYRPEPKTRAYNYLADLKDGLTND